MSGVKANWHLDALVPDDGRDPFAGQSDVEEVGKPIDLSLDRAALSQRAVELFHEERVLHDGGLRCEIKDQDDTSCTVCPLRDCGPLCDIGIEQDRVLTELAVAKRAR